MLFGTILMTIIGCDNDGDKYNNLILTDENTGKKYLLKHNFVDSYFIDEAKIKIVGNDTILVFTEN